MRNTNPERKLSGDAASREPVQARRDDPGGPTGGDGDRTSQIPSAALAALTRLMGTLAAREQIAASTREEGEGDDP